VERATALTTVGMVGMATSAAAPASIR
jgi:hypothetical protein